MDIGIISDIHGDFAALATALDRLETYHQVDEIVCAGDLVGRGPEPERVVQMIRERDIPTVRGNHDEWSAGMREENRHFLKTLPMEWRATYDQVTVFMCHGKPGNNLWGLYRDHVSDTLINMMLGSLSAQVMITGHTHMPLFMRVRHGCLINPGSLYTFSSIRQTSHSYGLLHLPDMTFDLYDVMGAPGSRIAYE